MAFTDTAALADQVIAAYDRAAYFALRAGSVFDQFATVKPGNVTSPGSSVSFLFYGDLTANTAVLSETVDVDPVALSDSLVTVTPQEHGNAVLTTLKLRTDSFAIGFDANVANLVAWNMVDSLETIAREAYDASGQTTFASSATSEGTITDGQVMTMNEIREDIADLRGDSVMPYQGNSFVAILHPDVEYDLMVETSGAGAWNTFVERQPEGAGDWYAGQVARAAGAVFVSTPRARVNSGGGSGTLDVYTTYILGDQAIAKAEPIPPHIVPGPVTDSLKRFVPLGWYAYLAYGQFRAAALNRKLSSSSLGTQSA